MRVLITGASGQLGRAMVRRFAATATVIPCTRQELDVTRAAEVQRVVQASSPDVIVNCTAYNAVDEAEEHAEEALEVNAFAVLALARAARACGAVFVHYGTDFVFDGRSTEPYLETDPPAPQSHYGRSKLLGEWLAAEAPDHYILRVESLFGGERAKSSVDRIVDALREGQPSRVFMDRTVSPSYVTDVAEATAQLLEQRPPAGLYHCVNSGATTWLGLAEEAARLLGCTPNLVPISVSSVELKAARPTYCALSNDKLRGAGIGMPTWQDALGRHIRPG